MAESDVMWYVQQQKESDLWYRILLEACKKFGVSYYSATPIQRAFIEEYARYQYDCLKARQGARPKETVRKFFESERVAVASE